MRIAVTGGTGFVGSAWLTERTMGVPLLAVAQARILEEGLTVAAPFGDALPDDLAPATPFSLDAIRAGLPQPGAFRLGDLRCLDRLAGAPGRIGS